MRWLRSRLLGFFCLFFMQTLLHDFRRTRLHTEEEDIWEQTDCLIVN